jgi:hypothetical protein
MAVCCCAEASVKAKGLIKHHLSRDIVVAMTAIRIHLRLARKGPIEGERLTTPRPWQMTNKLHAKEKHRLWQIHNNITFYISSYTFLILPVPT